MIRVYLDVNVSLDLIEIRQPFYNEGEYLVRCADIRFIKLMVSSGSIATLLYFTNKHKIANPDEAVWKLLARCDIVNAYKSTLSSAFHSDFRDKEDASEYFTALDNHADYFLTRDTKDFKKSLSQILPVLTPIQFKDIIDDHTIFASPGVIS